MQQDVMDVNCLIQKTIYTGSEMKQNVIAKVMHLFEYGDFFETKFFQKVAFYKTDGRGQRENGKEVFLVLFNGLQQTQSVRILTVLASHLFCWVIGRLWGGKERLFFEGYFFWRSSLCLVLKNIFFINWNLKSSVNHRQSHIQCLLLCVIALEMEVFLMFSWACWSIKLFFWKLKRSW